MNKFQRALRLQNQDTPPIWLMRQAGRYHNHYQNLRKTYGFLDLCRKPDVALETAMGPIRDFDFDAAILFSDILFPIEQMGPSLDFDPAPKFSYYLNSYEDLKKFASNPERIENLKFQRDALDLMRQELKYDKGIIGFVGGLATLYFFAVEGSQRNGVENALSGLQDGRFEGFLEKLLPMMIANMHLQAEANPDCIAILDSAAGLLPFDVFQNKYLPFIQELVVGFKSKYPKMPVLYYGKPFTPEHWQEIAKLNIQGFGVDHGLIMPDMVENFGTQYALQGNLSPDVMSLEQAEAQKQIDAFLSEMKQCPKEKLKGWICGLGHGITPTAHEDNVRYFVKRLREVF